MNILITGASRGIGFDTAVELSKNAEHKVIALSRNKAGLELLLQQAVNNNIDVYPVDITALDKQSIAELLDSYGHIDILINNAGSLINKPFTETTLADWQSIFNSNLFAVAGLIQLVLPYMQKNELSHIINIGSMGGFQGTSKFNGLSVYSASKAALANLTECLAEELKEWNIRVNCLALGAVNTDMLNNAFPGYKAPIESTEMAHYIADFSTNAHRFINGKIMPIALNTP